MEDFLTNYKKKDYDKKISYINQEYKGKSSQKDIIMRKIETSQEYENAIMQNSDVNLPEGLELNNIDDKELLEKAKDQVLKIAYNFDYKLKSKDLLTNYRFYINTAYFDRNGSDPYPLYKLEDGRVNFISELVFKAINLMNINNFDKEMLNIIIRVYRPGDVLNFHSDREIFGENIYGIVLFNSDTTRGLVLKNRKESYMLKEKSGLVWKLSGESRWKFNHGYCSYFHSQNDYVRISITFRFYQKKSQILKKAYEDED